MEIQQILIFDRFWTEISKSELYIDLKYTFWVRKNQKKISDPGENLWGRLVQKNELERLKIHGDRSVAVKKFFLVPKKNFFEAQSELAL